MTTFRQLLDQFEESASSKTAKGRTFEVFCEQFLRTDPVQTERFDEVWSWMDWPGRNGRTDTGIDLVAKERGTGHLVGIQCKFYSPRAVLDWKHVSTFVGMLGQPDFHSGLIISTAGKESKNLQPNLDNNSKSINIWRVQDFEDSRVNWDRFTIDRPTQLHLRKLKSLWDHQETAVKDVLEGFEKRDRGQMIMACGTGKTFTSLRLAEQLIGKGGTVLFLVPSINLLSQAVKAWASDASIPLNTFAVCSDTNAGKRRDEEDMSPNDLSFPASTNPEELLAVMEAVIDDGHMNVVFSTYQSIDVIHQCQQSQQDDEFGLDKFDLILCDEAHRTTGAGDGKGEVSHFQKVHQDEWVAAKKRLYMTATPRIYGDQTKAKAAENDIFVASMDNEAVFGPVFHELPFGEAVAKKLLTDYKVLVLAVNEDDVSSAFQSQLTSEDGSMSLNDVARMVGCWHGLSKRGPQFGDDSKPMQRAVAFSSTIKQSKLFRDQFPAVVNAALENRANPNAVRIETEHVDGTVNVRDRSEAIAWVEEDPGHGVCRVLSNAKCLTEGVDVPALDAVLFLQPRKSVVDIVQAVGRVMRLAEGKEFGYVILPIAVPAGVAPEVALKNNKQYQVVWQVLQALRSHDERLAAEINKIDINKGSSKIEIIGIGVSGGDASDSPGSVLTTTTSVDSFEQLAFPELDAWREALYIKVVEKVGDRRYMDSWAADIASIAASQETRIRTLLEHPEQNPATVEQFDVFLTALQNNLNDGITRDHGIAMLSQHLITRPVFEALFGGDEFTKKNPVSQVMQGMLDALDDTNLETERATLEGFYEHIRMLIGGIDSAEGRQQVITELYEKFFKKALPKASAALGIVYTPIEIVDFINRSVNDLLKIHFDGASLADEGVHILDPFAGTGTFITRLIQSGLIPPHALARKYADELHANEIMLLAYYIAAINIELAFNNAEGAPDGYEPFEGMVLTDTFQLAEEGDPMDEVLFPQNNERADRQKQLDIRVIVGNPPYSVGQTSQNDDNQNQSYPTLDASIESTYSAESVTKTGRRTKSGSLYDSYVRAFRWASNQLLDQPDGGVIGFVTNGGWLDSNSGKGIRTVVEREFHDIYIFNLRGNTRTSGEQARREGGQTFGAGSRATVAITLLVKRSGAVPAERGQIQYRDIGDYLDREEKLAIVDESTIDSIEWDQVTPNDHHDWINQRNASYEELVALEGEPDAIFALQSNGLKTNRDAWVYNSSGKDLQRNVESMIDFYNQQLDGFTDAHPPAGETKKARSKKASDFVDRDDTRYSWDLADFNRMANGTTTQLTETMVRSSLYRPFFGQWVVFDRAFNNSIYQLPKLCPTPDPANVGYYSISSKSKAFSVLATDQVPDLALYGSESGKFFARWRYEKIVEGNTLLDFEAGGRVSNLNPAGVQRFKDAVGADIDDDAVFEYVYGVLHSPNFRREFESSLKKEGPRVPLADSRATFDAFRVAGRELLDLHTNYEDVEPYPLTEQWRDGVDPASSPELLLVGKKKMAYPKLLNDSTGMKVADKTRLIYNPHLTLGGIPPEAHDYVLGTRSAIDWLIDRYYVKTHKASGIVNDVNKWGLEQGNPRYIIDLIKKVTTVSVRTVEIVKSLPTLEF